MSKGYFNKRAYHRIGVLQRTPRIISGLIMTKGESVITSKRFSIIVGCCHMQKAVTTHCKCKICKKEIPQGKYSIKGRSDYFHTDCFVEKYPELKKRVEKALEKAVVEEI